MPQSLAQIYVHIVFSTKNRQPFLVDKTLRAACHAYLAGTCKARGSPSLIVGGVEDHVHILCTLNRDFYNPLVVSYCQERGIFIPNDVDILTLLRRPRVF